MGSARRKLLAPLEVQRTKGRVHIAVFDAGTIKSADEAATIKRMIDAWNARYSRWRGLEKIPNFQFV